MAKLYPQVLRILRTIHEQYHMLSDSWLNEEYIETIFPLEVRNALYSEPIESDHFFTKLKENHL